MDNTNDSFVTDTELTLDDVDEPKKKVFFHQWVHFQISKNPSLVKFARYALLSSYPRYIHNVEFGDIGEWFITYNEGEEPVRYENKLTKDMYISDVSWSSKYQCYFDYFTGCPFVVTSDIVILLYLASLEGSASPEFIGEWMRSATKGRYVGFNPVHLSR